MSVVTTYGVTVSLMATLLWTTIFSYTSIIHTEEAPRDYKYKGTMVALLVLSAVSMIAAAYNAGDPIDWLLCKLTRSCAISTLIQFILPGRWIPGPAFHATALDAGAWSVGVYEL